MSTDNSDSPNSSIILDSFQGTGRIRGLDFTAVASTGDDLSTAKVTLRLAIHFPYGTTGDDLLSWLDELVEPGTPSAKSTKLKLDGVITGRTSAAGPSAPPKDAMVKVDGQGLTPTLVDTTPAPVAPTPVPVLLQPPAPAVVSAPEPLAANLHTVTTLGQAAGVLGQPQTIPLQASPVMPPPAHAPVAQPAFPQQPPPQPPQQTLFNQVAAAAPPAQQQNMFAPIAVGGSWHGERISWMMPTAPGQWTFGVGARSITVDKDCNVLVETGKPEQAPEQALHPLTAAVAANNMLDAPVRTIVEWLMQQGHDPKAIVAWSRTAPSVVTQLVGTPDPGSRVIGSLIALGVPQEKLA